MHSMDCTLMSAPLHSISAAESPARSGHRIIGRPCDGSVVNAVGRAAAARIADAANPEEIVPTLSVERLSRERDTEDTDGACLIVANSRDGSCFGRTGRP